ncbi:nucleophile aminohydrolase [Baffinella frigidus]|nr:nucleophile aminohydrolase [Cryptophyta sp. CCMP2293]
MGNAVNNPEFQYLEERDACGVGFVATRKGDATHDVVHKATVALGCMEHRGACGADSDSGDGAGLMTQIPWELFSSMVKGDDIKKSGVGMMFLPQDSDKRAAAKAAIEEVAKKNGLAVLGWREVPVNPKVLGELALAVVPTMEQIVLQSEAGLTGDELEQQLYVVMRSVQTAVAQKGVDWDKDGVYTCSMSGRTIVYKGMVRSSVLSQFFSDLTDEKYKSRFAIYHRRFSTNTMPKWPLAQPFRTLGHNGEINTLLGNINWMRAREAVMDQTVAFRKGTDLSNIDPLSNAKMSDSSNLDESVTLATRAGKSPMEALMIMVPEAYKNQPELKDKQEITDFYDYYSGLQEAWDGPALLVFSDGKKVGASLDRNGLRPARYLTTTDGLVCIMSETGVVPGLDDAKIDLKGRLGPGQMISLDLETGDFDINYDIKAKIAKAKPFGKWIKAQQTYITEQPFSSKRIFDSDLDLIRQQVVFGWSSEDMEMQIADMAATGKETTFCMGDDTPLAVLSSKPHVPYNYFKQRFAQVTNPAIDPLRENLVMSLDMYLGKKGNCIEEATEENAKQIRINTPVLNENEMDLIKTSGRKVAYLSTLYPLSVGPSGLKDQISRICKEAEDLVKGGAEIIVITDYSKGGVTADQTYVPNLVAVGAVHHHLLEQKLRLNASIIAETAQAWSTHHVAMLVGYGASAVHMYGAMEAVRSWHGSTKTQALMKNGRIPEIDVETALSNFRESLNAGLYKIMSKIGISLLSSYHAAQIFEAIGIGEDVINAAFKGTVSRVGGLTLEDLANEVASLQSAAFPETPLKNLENYGFVKFYTGKEYHHNAPPLTKILHKAIREKDVDQYKLFQESIKNAPISVLRDLLDIKSDRKPVPLSDVEPVEAIMRKFCTGGTTDTLSQRRWDVVLGALAGAEEYGFGTIAMIAEGCIMARICHTNNCPVGVTTQKAALRKKFPGTPEAVVNYFQFVAEEVRSVMAHLGYTSLDELVGRGDMLVQREGVAPVKTKNLDLTYLTDAINTKNDRSWVPNSNGPVLDDDILADKDISAAITSGSVAKKEWDIVNTDRTVGARVAGVIASQWGNKGFEDKGGNLHLTFKGSAGQSFGAFNLPGMTMEVVGEVNDYVGKGIHGGSIIIRPPPGSKFDPAANVIVGNTALYGATGGSFFANGRAGERFAVRNSRCRAVVEGAGDHALEYMTGGVVVMLGETGRNVAAGMTGGIAYILEEKENFVEERLNHEIVTKQRVITKAGEEQLKGLLEEHAEKTGSPKAKALLADWATSVKKFWQIVPPAEKKLPECSEQVLEVAVEAAAVAA